MSELIPRAVGRATVGESQLSWRVARSTQRALDVVQGRSEVALARIQTAADEAADMVHARNGLAVIAAQDDCVMSGIINALPVYDVSDADFRAQLKHATRAGVIGDILRFQG